MGKYSLVESRMVIPYDTIEVKYLVKVDLSFMSLFLFLSIKNTTKKRVDTYFRIYKPVQITGKTKREFNVRTRKIKES